VQEKRADGVVRQTRIPLHHFQDGWRIITPPKMVGVLGRFLSNPQLWASDSANNKGK